MGGSLLLLLPALSCALHSPPSVGHQPPPHPQAGLLSPQVKSRVAFGKALVEQGTILEDVSQLCMEIEQAAGAENCPPHGREEIRLSNEDSPKGFLPSCPICQDFGPAGPSSDCPLAQFFAWAHAPRFADGPGEVHRAVVAKMELKHCM